jgi:hypothetical protein
VTTCGMDQVAGGRQAFSWPAARRYLFARVLRVPVRHLASLSREADQFQARCVCGWQGEWHGHPGAAFSAAHVHTRYVQTVISQPEAARL